MRHYSESITTLKISRSERLRIERVQHIVRTLGNHILHTGLSDHFTHETPVKPLEIAAEPILPLQGPHLTGFTPYGEYDELHRAYFDKPTD